ncbi:hypothetical protein [Altererythrobacter lutimaris]|uniref:Uncharacterized protein n=1 Tax=Altererythrobacter lutimaris TaxID=2743979 RepID=A0A850HAU2_9SPHN|nr:hypothetical protein [Altererythrobacter lutimaris]NVE95143.1 hypothetical protein [Altererythrobacter lutimaris]
MDRDTLFISAVVIVGVLAILNAWRGAVLLRSGDQAGGRKHLVLGLCMIMMIALANFYRGG